MINLRDYQRKAIDSTFEEWKENDSTLCVLPTGTGKTTIFTEIINRSLPKRALILVHREELLTQAKNRLMDQSGIDCEIEMGSFKASTSLFNRAPCVVATVQTMYSGDRIAKFDPSDFSILICDEAHHYTSPSYKRVVDYFRQNKELKVLGVTATPDRTDEEALGQIFDSVAYDYEILDAIHDGWLVPVDQQMVFIDSLDFSNMRTTAGDLNGSDLAEIMEKEEVLQGVASSSIEIIGSKRTLAFTSSVKHAEMLSCIFNRHREGMSDWVCGMTPKDERREKLDKFKTGKTQVMVNCGVLTEGFDSPEVEVIIQARPTKSRCLYAQIIGRSLRPLPGLVDSFESSSDRKLAISTSRKPSALIIDFVGNAGRHKLMSSADILGGNVSDQAIDRAIEIAKKGGVVRMDETLDEAEEELKKEQEIERLRRAKLEEIARKTRIVAKANFKKTSINPFDAFNIEPARQRGWDNGKSLSEKQRGMLQKQGIDPDEVSYTQGKQLIIEMFRRWNGKLATMKQCNLLNRHGFETKNMTMQEASGHIDALSKNGWKRPVSIV